MSPKILGLVGNIVAAVLRQIDIRDISRQKRADILLLFDEGAHEKTRRLHGKRGAWPKTLGDEVVDWRRLLE